MKKSYQAIKTLKIKIQMKKIGAPLQKNDTENKDTKDYKNVKKTLKEKKEERNILKKDKDSKKKQKEVKTKANDNNSPRKKLKIYILVDIMIKKLNDYFLTKKVRTNTLSKYDHPQEERLVVWLIT